MQSDQQIKSFKDKVQSMSAKEIIMSMVSGLRKPWTDRVVMDTYGDVIGNAIYVGCAATNTICTIMSAKFPKESLYGRDSRATLLGVDSQFLRQFERAINMLRLGSLCQYNNYALIGGFSQITKEKENTKLPMILNNYDEEILKRYEEFANSL